MGRAPRYSVDEILDAARQLAVDEGVSGVTMTAIADALDAPSGSIYHRFANRDHLVAALWLRTAERFQGRFIEKLQSGSDPVASAVDAASWVVEWSTDHPADAALLAIHHRRHFVGSEYPPELTEQAKRLGSQLREALGRVAEALDMRGDEIEFALTGIPLAAVRPALTTGRTPSDRVRRAVEHAVRAAVIGSSRAHAAPRA